LVVGLAVQDGVAEAESGKLGVNGGLALAGSVDA